MKLLVLLAALAAACAHFPAGPGPAAATAEGWAPVVKGDPAGTRRRALADALRAAVEKATGVRVTSTVRVDRAMTTDDAVTARAAGLVRSYEIVRESEADGFHRTTVRALVDRDARTEDAPAGPPTGDPKVAVRFAGPNGAEAASGVRRGLIARGFTVVQDGADIVVQGEVAVARIGFAGMMASSRARVDLEARTARGRIIWTASREASALGAEPVAAGRKASELAGRLGGEELANAVAARLGQKE